MKKTYEAMEAVKVTFDAKEQMAAAACNIINVGGKYCENDFTAWAKTCSFMEDATNTTYIVAPGGLIHADGTPDPFKTPGADLTGWFAGPTVYAS